MSTIGHAVGDWNSGKKVYPNPEFVNARGNTDLFGYSTTSVTPTRGRGSSFSSTEYPFYLPNIYGRNLRFKLGISSSKVYRDRKALVDKYAKQGVTPTQIENFWGEYKSRGLDSNNLQAFDVFIRQQRLLKDAQIKKEEELLAQLEEEEKQKEISDLNLFPPTVDETPTDVFTPTVTDDSMLESKPNYLLYGGIGLAVLIGGFIIFKRK